MDANDEVTLRDYWRVVARRKWIVVACVVVAVAAALGVSSLQDPIYVAETEVRVEPRATSAVFEQDTSSAPSLERAIQTEIRVIEGEHVRERVREDVGLDDQPPNAEASSVEGTDVVVVEVRSGDPDVAARLADQYVQAYIDTRRDDAIASLGSAEAELQRKVTELQEQIDAIDTQAAAAAEADRAQVTASLSAQRQTLVSQQAAFKSRLDQLQVDSALTTGGASVIQSASVPSGAVAPTPAQAALLAAVIGLLLGLGGAFLLDYLDDSLRAVEDLERLTDRPVLATVPISTPPDARPIALSAPHDVAAETYRGLRTNVQFLSLDTPLRVLQVTSSLPGEGKTTTVTNLAVVLADAGNRVVIVDADLRRPRVHEVFGVPPVPGLTEALLGDDVTGLVHHTRSADVLTAGSVPPNPSEMLSSPRLALLLRDLVEHYDYVLVDSAPVLPVADSIALAAAVDGVLVVTQANRTSKRTLTETLARLARVNTTVIGIVLNRARRGRDVQGYGYGYGYGYGAAAGPSSAAEPGRPAIEDAPLPEPADDRTSVGERA
jgi:non-specific protein-tyrosine kinase